jgi:hypothetical protein
VKVLRRLTLVALVTVAAATWSATASARGGHYVFEGGTAGQQRQVRAALEISSFNWSVVPAVVTIHLHKGTDTYATAGDIWVDTDLVAAGMFAWGPIQHEYAHQVDFFLLNDALRAQLNTALGGATWSRNATLASLHGPGHATLGAERFASTLVWAYWQSSDNSLRPTGKKSESAAMAPDRFRALLERMLGIPNPAPPVVLVD